MSSSDSNRHILEGLYEKYLPKLYLYLHYFTDDEAEIKDIIQDTFLKFLESNLDLEDIQNISGYLFFCVKNTMFNHLKGQKNRNRLLKELFNSESLLDKDVFDEEIDSRQFEEQLNLCNEAIKSLPPTCKDIFEMSKKSGMTYKQIARTRNISIKTVETQIGIALKRIREFVSKKSKNL